MSPYQKSIVKNSTADSSDAIARVVYHDFTRWRARVLMIKRVRRYCNRITAGQINYYAEIAPCTVYQLYGSTTCG